MGSENTADTVYLNSARELIRSMVALWPGRQQLAGVMTGQIIPPKALEWGQEV
jgi:hypothetical protein